MRNLFIVKKCVFAIQVDVWERENRVSLLNREEVRSNFGRVWSDKTRKSMFMFFLEILETHIITNYPKLGHRVARLVLVVSLRQGTISGAIK